MSWQKSIILNPAEQVMHSWEGNCERQHKQFVQKRVMVVLKTTETITNKEVHSGTLVLTNQRLLWFERRGFLSQTQRASFDIDLTTLQGITCGGVLVKWVSITNTDSEYIFHLRGIGSKEVEPFKDMILRQVQNAKVVATNNTQGAFPTVQREVITREVVMIPCQYCGGLNIQTVTFCSHCGAKRRA